MHDQILLLPTRPNLNARALFFADWNEELDVSFLRDIGAIPIRKGLFLCYKDLQPAAFFVIPIIMQIWFRVCGFA